MATVRSHIRIACDPDAVYALVADSGKLGEWFPGIESIAIDGKLRTVTLPDGATVVEEIVTDDPQLRRFQYRIAEGMPLEHHLSTIDVIADGSGALVVYGADVRPDEIGPAMAPALEAAVAGLKTRLES